MSRLTAIKSSLSLIIVNILCIHRAMDLNNMYDVELVYEFVT